MVSDRSGETPTVPRGGESVRTKLLRIAEKARREPKFRFTSLFHLMKEELLRGCFDRLCKDAAAGIEPNGVEGVRELDRGSGYQRFL